MKRRVLSLRVAFFAATALASLDCSYTDGFFEKTGSHSTLSGPDTTSPVTGSGIALSANTGTTITVSWGQASDDQTAVNLLEYRLLRSSSADLTSVAAAEANGNEVIPYQGNTLSFNATGLTPCVTYYFAVIVRDQAGNKSLYSQQSVTMQPTVSCVTTVAGSVAGNVDDSGSAARFNNPGGITSLSGLLYISDYTNSSIRQLNPATGSVTTWKTSITQPEHLTASGGDIYIAGNHCIRRANTGSVTTFAGQCGTSGLTNSTGTSARFSNPVGMAALGSDLYVGDANNHLIRKLDSSATVTTYAGTGSSGAANGDKVTVAMFYQPHGLIAVGSDLYVADYLNHCIRKIDATNVSTLAGLCATSGTADGTGSAARFRYPRAVASDGTNLFIADEGNHCIRKIVISSGLVSTIAGSCGNLSTGTTDGHGPDARFNSPGVLTLYSGEIYVADTQNHRIRKITLP